MQAQDTYLCSKCKKTHGGVVRRYNFTMFMNFEWMRTACSPICITVYLPHQELVKHLSSPTMDPWRQQAFSSVALWMVRLWILLKLIYLDMNFWILLTPISQRCKVQDRRKLGNGLFLRKTRQCKGEEIKSEHNIAAYIHYFFNSSFINFPFYQLKGKELIVNKSKNRLQQQQ